MIMQLATRRPPTSKNISMKTYFCLDDIDISNQFDKQQNFPTGSVLQKLHSETAYETSAYQNSTKNLSQANANVRTSTFLNRLIAEWHGCVVSIHEDYFIADMEGLIGQGVEGSSEEAIIPISDIQAHDKEQFRVGAFFRLCINYQQLPNKKPVRLSTINFRRLPAYSKFELNEADKRAEELLKSLHVE